MMAADVYRRTARAYDLLYDAAGKDYGEEARELGALIQASCPGAASLLDVACGTGRHLAHLADHYDVAGVDLSPAMLAVARDRLPDCPLVEGDFRTFALDRTFDAVVCLFSSIAYLRAQEELDLAIENMARHLGPGGVLIVDGWVRPDAWRDPGHVHVLAAADGGLAVSRVGVSRRDGSRSVLEMHHLIGSLDGVEHVVERHELTLFSTEAYRSAFARAGLEVEIVPSPYPDRDRHLGTRPR